MQLSGGKSRPSCHFPAASSPNRSQRACHLLTAFQLLHCPRQCVLHTQVYWRQSKAYCVHCASVFCPKKKKTPKKQNNQTLENNIKFNRPSTHFCSQNCCNEVCGYLVDVDLCHKKQYACIRQPTLIPQLPPHS